MLVKLDIKNEEFDSIVGCETESEPIIYLDMPVDIKEIYEFNLVNSIVNISDFKDQLIHSNIPTNADSIFVFGKMNIKIEGVKGAEFEIVEGDFFEGKKQYYTWEYVLSKGDVICKCGGNLAFSNNYYASIIVVTKSQPKITLTFNTEEVIPFNFMDNKSIALMQSKITKLNKPNNEGKLFDINYYEEHCGSGCIVLKDE